MPRYDCILMAQLPAEAKSLGRGVEPWHQARRLPPYPFPDLPTYPPPHPPILPTSSLAYLSPLCTWAQARWDAVVCGVASSVVLAKFAKVPGLAEVRSAAQRTAPCIAPCTGCVPVALTPCVCLTAPRCCAARATRCSQRRLVTTRRGAAAPYLRPY